MAVKIIENNNKERKTLLFEGVDKILAVPLKEYLKSGISTGWNYDTFEEELEDFISDMDRELMEGKRDTIEKDIKVGDIIMVSDFESPVSGEHKDKPHRFLVIMEVGKDEENGNIYKGYELQSSNGNPKSRANIFNKDKDHYANNIWIGDFKSILNRGRTTQHNECYIDVGNPCTFNDSGIEDEGFWKGHVTEEFKDFITTCSINAATKNIEANKEMQWPMVKKENKLTEGSMSRLLQHANEGQIAFIIGWRSGNTRKQNSEANMNLSKDLQNAGLSFSKVKGGYIESTDANGNKLDKPEEVEENTFAVYNNKFRPEDFIEFMVKLCGKYNQECVLVTDSVYKDDEGRTRYYGYKRGPVNYNMEISSKYLDRDGNIVSSFEGITINDVQEYYTKIFGKKFAFTESLDIIGENFKFQTNTVTKVAMAVSNYKKIKDV